MVCVYSRAEGSALEDMAGEEGVWVCHATGKLASPEEVMGERGQAAECTEAQAHTSPLLAADAWPPPGAELVQIEDLYDHLAERQERL